VRHFDSHFIFQKPYFRQNCKNDKCNSAHCTLHSVLIPGLLRSFKDMLAGMQKAGGLDLRLFGSSLSYIITPLVPHVSGFCCRRSQIAFGCFYFVYVCRSQSRFLLTVCLLNMSHDISNALLLYMCLLLIIPYGLWPATIMRSGASRPFLPETIRREASKLHSGKENDTTPYLGNLAL
jgi:hypothetical protein